MSSMTLSDHKLLKAIVATPPDREVPKLFLVITVEPRIGPFPLESGKPLVPFTPRDITDQPLFGKVVEVDWMAFRWDDARRMANRDNQETIKRAKKGNAVAKWSVVVPVECVPEVGDDMHRQHPEFRHF